MLFVPINDVYEIIDCSNGSFLYKRWIKQTAKGRAIDLSDWLPHAVALVETEHAYRDPAQYFEAACVLFRALFEILEEAE